MTPNIIYDDRIPEDLPRIESEMARQEIDEYTIWPAIVDKSSVVASINASHKRIVGWAMEKKIPEICVMEQDVMFPSYDGWKYFMSKKPKEYDIYLSSTYILPVELKKIVGFHCYCVCEKFYERFLSVPIESHIDTAICDLKPDVHICYPFAALQRPGFSRNNGTSVNYNSILSEKDVYGKFR